jgi:hypothetical protein
MYKMRVNWLVRITDYLNFKFYWNCFQNYMAFNAADAAIKQVFSTISGEFDSRR